MKKVLSAQAGPDLRQEKESGKGKRKKEGNGQDCLFERGDGGEHFGNENYVKIPEGRTPDIIGGGYGGAKGLSRQHKIGGGGDRPKEVSSDKRAMQRGEGLRGPGVVYPATIWMHRELTG